MPKKNKLPDISPDETIRWLHISDLHLGQPGEHLWHQAREEFEDDLERMLKRIGAPPDLVFASSGAEISSR